MEGTIDLLLRTGARVNSTGRNGNTAAHCAADQGRCRALKTLALDGVDFNIRNWVSPRTLKRLL